MYRIIIKEDKKCVFHGNFDDINLLETTIKIFSNKYKNCDCEYSKFGLADVFTFKKK